MAQGKYTVVEHLGGMMFGIASPTGDVARGLFPTREQAQRFAEKLNEMALAPVHFFDVVEDYLYESYCNSRGAACAGSGNKRVTKRYGFDFL